MLKSNIQFLVSRVSCNRVFLLFSFSALFGIKYITEFSYLKRCPDMIFEILNILLNLEATGDKDHWMLHCFIVAECLLRASVTFLWLLFCSILVIFVSASFDSVLVLHLSFAFHYRH